MTRQSWAVFAALILLATGLTACAGNPKPGAGEGPRRGTLKPGTGDVAFRLKWTGKSDLDLYVQDPRGNCVFFAHKESATGAILDIDCNGGTDQMCENPVENVYWPTSTAPAGTYKFWVAANSLVLTEGPVPFEAQLLEGNRVVWSRKGEIQDQDERFGPFAYAYATAGAVPVETSEPPQCSVYATVLPEELLKQMPPPPR